MTLTVETARHIIEGALACLLDPAASVDRLRDHFTDDYVQDVDGSRLDLAGFLDHAQALKATLAGGRATVDSLVVDGNTAADIHVVEARKRDGGRVTVRVVAFFDIRDGRIARVAEITRLIDGSAADADLGSRRLSPTAATTVPNGLGGAGDR